MCIVYYIMLPRSIWNYYENHHNVKSHFGRFLRRGFSAVPWPKILAKFHCFDWMFLEWPSYRVTTHWGRHKTRLRYSKFYFQRKLWLKRKIISKSLLKSLAWWLLILSTWLTIFLRNSSSWEDLVYNDHINTIPPLSTNNIGLPLSQSIE